MATNLIDLDALDAFVEREEREYAGSQAAAATEHTLLGGAGLVAIGVVILLGFITWHVAVVVALCLLIVLTGLRRLREIQLLQAQSMIYQRVYLRAVVGALAAAGLADTNRDFEPAGIAKQVSSIAEDLAFLVTRRKRLDNLRGLRRATADFDRAMAEESISAEEYAEARRQPHETNSE